MDAGTPAQRVVPWMRSVVLQPAKFALDRRRAMVVDQTLPTICQERHCDSVQLSSREGRYRRVGCCRLAGPGLLVRTGDSRCPGQASTRPVVKAATVDANTFLRLLLPESRGVRGEVAPRCIFAVRAVWLRAVRGAALPLLHRAGRAEWGALQQHPSVMLLGRGRWGRLWVVPYAQVPWICGIRVRPAVLGSHPWEEEELV